MDEKKQLRGGDGGYPALPLLPRIPVLGKSNTADRAQFEIIFHHRKGWKYTQAKALRTIVI